MMNEPYNWPLMWDSSTQCKDTDVVDDSSNCVVDTSLCLSTYDSGSTKRKRNDGSLNLKKGISLSLGLGSSGSYLETKNKSTALSFRIDIREQSFSDVSVEFDVQLGSKRACKEFRNTCPRVGALERERCTIDLGLSLSTNGATESGATSVTLASSPVHNNMAVPPSSDIVQLVDEGSTSAKWKTGLILPLKGQSSSMNHSKQPRKTAVKNCQFSGCEKGARGASGHCISHGGGPRCQRPGCSKGAEGRTTFCKAHGGGRRCDHFGCTKSADGRTDFCITHGGGKRCGFPAGCARAARARSGLCIRHGGGNPCKIENCKTAAEGRAGLCITHGGGPRCHFSQCTKGAQGSTKLCKAHGGGKRCSFLRCTKGAEGSTPFCKAHGGGKRCSFGGGGICSKCVHGGTLLCSSHGGGKRCALAGCTKGARGRTKFCVGHGGGNRCKVENCGKGAQGSTHFCKAHGRGVRCSWGKGHGGNLVPCDKFAREKNGLCATHTAQVQDKRVHGNGTVDLKMKGAITYTRTGEGSLTICNGFGFGGHVHCLTTTTQNVVPIEFRGSCSTSRGTLPEGRVHGGSLMAMLRGDPGLEPEGAVHGCST